MQPLTRGPEADETKTMTARLHATLRLSVSLSKRRQQHLARSRHVRLHSTRALLATRRRHGVQGQEQLCRRALHASRKG